MPFTGWRRLIPVAFFGSLLLLGIWLHRDYGVSWDEPTDHQNGSVSGRYVAELLLPGLLRGNPTLATIPPITNYTDNDHGVAFELPVAALGLLLTPGNQQGYFFLRHLLIFFTAVVGIWALYRLGSIYFRREWLGLLAALLLVLSPRLFAESFFNGKDVPFMVFFALGMYTLVRLLARPTSGRVLAHALATAVAIDIRVPGVLLVAFTLGMLGLEILWPVAERLSVRRGLLLVISYLVLTAVFVVVGWPALWADPVGHFITSFRSLSHYKWPAATNFYLGQHVPAKQLPWHYIPVWIASTTPVLYLAAAVLGLAAGLYQAYQKGWARLQTMEGRLDLLLAGWLFGPVVLVVGLGSVLYDGWRHLYFIYPALLLWAVRGASVLLSFIWQQHKAWQLAALGLASLELVRIGYQMVKLHPYQHLYFSVLSAQEAENLMERDYWGLSFREGLEWILAHDTSPQITIRSFSHHPLYNNTLILSPAERARFRYLPTKEARYYLTNYRWHPQSFLDSMGTEVYVVRAGGVKILSVFRRD